MNCYQCGQKMDKPYAIWHWQSGKPAKNYCWLCWESTINELRSPKELSKTREQKCNGFMSRVLIKVTGYIICLVSKLIRRLVNTTPR